MPAARINEKGQLVDAVTGKVLGKMQNGKIVMNAIPPPRTVQQSNSNSSNSNIQSNISSVKKIQETSYKKLTKYEVTKDSNFIIRFGLFEQQGRFIPIKQEAVQNYKSAEQVWVKFRMWTFTEELEWKNQCNEFNPQLKCQTLNIDKLNEMKIKRLILDWSFAENYDRLKLLHTDGILSDESYNMFKGLYPAIANTIIDLMNNVLENNL